MRISDWSSDVCSSDLSEFGFSSAPDVQVGNDPVYVDQNMECQGQIRFGANGLAAASSVWLVAPCAELVQDGRGADTVDLALGTYKKGALTPNPDATAPLQLGRASRRDRVCQTEYSSVVEGK